MKIKHSQRFSIENLHFQHLVEIAIIELAVMANTDERTTHESWGRVRIEGIDKFSHVVIKCSQLIELRCKAIDRHIRDCIKVIKE